MRRKDFTSYNRQHLLKIKSGAFSYDQLLNEIIAKVAALDKLFAQSQLPDEPNRSEIEESLISIRREFYKRKS